MRFINCIDINKKICLSFSATLLGQEEFLVSGELSVLNRCMYVVLYFQSTWLACGKPVAFFLQLQKNKPSLTHTVNSVQSLVLAIETQGFGNWFFLNNQV